MSDCRFGVSPVNYPDPDPELSIIMIRILDFVVYTKKMNLCLLKLSIL